MGQIRSRLMVRGMGALTICILKGALCSQTDDNDVDPFCLKCLCCHCHILDKGIHFWLITVVNLCQSRCREVSEMNSPRRPLHTVSKLLLLMGSHGRLCKLPSLGLLTINARNGDQFLHQRACFHSRYQSKCSPSFLPHCKMAMSPGCTLASASS